MCFQIIFGDSKLNSSINKQVKIQVQNPTKKQHEHVQKKTCITQKNCKSSNEFGCDAPFKAFLCHLVYV
jgi:hypothetical protein